MDLVVKLIGGIALLLWAIRMVRTGFTRAYGSELRRFLSNAMRWQISAFGAGLAITALIQSSTATALIVSSFAGRGLITGSAALAILLGADVGTTLVVQVLSLGLEWLSPLLVAAGVFGFLSTKSSRPRALSRAAIGLGLALLSLRLLGEVSGELKDMESFTLLFAWIADEPFLALLLCALFTWLSHSSVAIVLLVMSLVLAQVISIPLAFTLVLGANLGGALIAVGATTRSAPAARRAPVGNLVMRAVSVAAIMPFLPVLEPYLAQVSGDTARMVANFHMGFNVLLALVFLPLIYPLDAVLRKLLPDGTPDEDPGRPRYLDEDALEMPAVALASSAREAMRMGETVQDMLEETIEAFRTTSGKVVRDIETSDDVVDKLHEAIKIYLARLTQEELDDKESSRCIEILTFTTNLEHIGDIIDKNLMELAAKKIKWHSSFSKAGMTELEAFHNRITGNFDLALNVFMSGDLGLARKLLQEKTSVRDLEMRYTENHYSRIGEGRPESIESSSLHLDVLRDLKRINSHLTSVAYPILERAGELANSRLLAEERISNA